jgi:hypothetical protein
MKSFDLAGNYNLLAGLKLFFQIIKIRLIERKPLGDNGAVLSLMTISRTFRR